VSEFTIPAPELARLTHNALAFMPARSAVKVCRLTYFFPVLEITATDLFTIGRDFATVGGAPGEASIDLSREDLQALDKAARAAKKEDARVIIRACDGMEYMAEDVHGSFLDSSAQRNPEDLWARCDELLARLAPEHLCLIDPKFMNPFGKIKASGGAETIADLSISDAGSQISVKIGATFRGAIMPVDREEAEASEEVGPEGLWGASS
jgi:hypothetical protein